MKRRYIILMVLCALFGGILPVSAEETTIEAGFVDPCAIEEVMEEHLELTAWKHELVEWKIQVNVMTPMEVRVEADPLVNPLTGETLDCTVSFLEPVQANLGMGAESYAPSNVVYDRIGTQDRYSLSAGETAWVWIRIPVEEAGSGAYYGDIRVIGDTTVTLQETIRVLPFDLNGQDLSFSLWQYPFSSLYYYEVLQGEEPFSDRHLDVLKEEMDWAKRVGVNRITCTITEEPWAHQTYYDSPSMVKWNVDGSGHLWFDYERLDRWIRCCESIGMNGPIDCFSILPFDEDITVYDDMNEPFRVVLEPGSEEWNWYWEGFLYSFLNHMEENGWLDRTVFMVDERGIPYFETAIQLVRSVPGGDRVHFGAAVNVIPRNKELYDQIDDLSVSIDSLPEGDEELETFLAERAASGLTTTMYNCSTNYPNAFLNSDPCESVWSMQYMTMRGLDGYLRWALNAWPMDPRNSGDAPHFESGDTFLIYPDEADAQNPVPEGSVRLSMIVRGLNDSKKYWVLERLVSEEERTRLEETWSSMRRYYGTMKEYGTIGAPSMEARLSLYEDVSANEAILSEISSDLIKKRTTDAIRLFLTKD